VKADRLIALLLLLQSGRRRTAGALAEALDVSERTIYRDVDALCAAGVPVFAERGPDGGIALSEGYRRALTHFGEDEIRALFASGASPLADLGMETGLERALEKLHGGLADVQRRAAEKARARIHLDRRRWNQGEPPRELLTALRRAVWDDRRVRIRYEDRTRKATTRTLDPLGLVAKAGVWYLIARETESGEMRSFRVERIREAHELATRFERPEDFDLERYWNESSARFRGTAPEYAVVLRVEPEALDDVGVYWTCEVLERDAGRAIVKLLFPGPEAALYQVLAWGAKVGIVEPAELRTLLVERAREALERHGTLQSTTRRKSVSSPAT
jgi:predicted DNA-binding transcriptional regulator YafY